MQEAAPVDDRLAPGREDDVRVAPEGAREPRPHPRRVVLVRRSRLIGRLVPSGSRPDQRELDVHAVPVEKVHVADDRLAVVGTVVRALDPVDAEPAVLVQRHPHEVDMPGRDRPHGRHTRRAVEDAPPLDAGVLRTRAVNAAQDHRAAAGVAEMRSDDVEAPTRSGPCIDPRRRDRGEEGQHEQCAHAAHPSERSEDRGARNHPQEDLCSAARALRFPILSLSSYKEG